MENFFADTVAEQNNFFADTLEQPKQDQSGGFVASAKQSMGSLVKGAG